MKDGFELTSEEALQSSRAALKLLNDEFSSLNSRLKETLDQRAAPRDEVRNLLRKTDIAMLLVDPDLNIRYFTPAAKVAPFDLAGEIGQSLADLARLSADKTLIGDARAVLRDMTPVERDVEAADGACVMRRISPYGSEAQPLEGLVILLLDMTAQKRTIKALEAAKEQAELANIAKTRFLAAASHDLRQPLQALVLLQGGLADSVEGERPKRLVARLGETLAAMSGMLSTLMGINQVETGTVHADRIVFPIRDLFDQLRSEFASRAQSSGLELRILPCSLAVYSDPRLLDQIIRNLVSNALKYTKRGKVLVGCRRRGDTLSIEIWDTGAGIPAKEIQAAFDEPPRADGGGPERGRGLGMGLSIVQWLAGVLGHRVRVHSKSGKGSGFAIEVALPPEHADMPRRSRPRAAEAVLDEDTRRVGTILIVEDDPEIRELLEFFLRDEGHETVSALDALSALQLVERSSTQPDLILADYALPNGMNGLQFAARMRAECGREIPAILLTGDLPTSTLRDLALENCEQFTKPLKLRELSRTIQRLLPESGMSAPTRAREIATRGEADTFPPAPRKTGPAKAEPTKAEPTKAETGGPIVFIVDDDSHVRGALRLVLEEEGKSVEDFEDCESFLDAYRPGREACLLVDAYLPRMSGLELLQKLHNADKLLPSIMITGNSDVPMAVQAMKVGALDFIEKPVGRRELLACVERALEQARDSGKVSAQREAAASQVAGLSPRQRQIMDKVLAGQSSKVIAWELGISQRTVEAHRGWVMKKMGARSLPELARVAFAAAWTGPDTPAA